MSHNTKQKENKNTEITKENIKRLRGQSQHNANGEKGINEAKAINKNYCLGTNTEGAGEGRMGNFPEWRKDLNIERTYEFQAELIKNNNNNKTPSQECEILGLKKK